MRRRSFIKKTTYIEILSFSGVSEKYWKSLHALLVLKLMVRKSMMQISGNSWKKKGKNTNKAKTERRKRRYSISRTRFTSVRMNFKGYFRSICIVTQCTLSLWILCSGNVIPLLIIIIKGRFTATFFCERCQNAIVTHVAFSVVLIYCFFSDVNVENVTIKFLRKQIKVALNDKWGVNKQTIQVTINRREHSQRNFKWSSRLFEYVTFFPSRWESELRRSIWN